MHSQQYLPVQLSHIKMDERGQNKKKEYKTFLEKLKT